MMNHRLLQILSKLFVALTALAVLPLGAAAAVNELLLQCTGGVIRLFPAVPQERSASFYQLRTQGAFLVSARKDADQIKNVTLRSECGGPVKLANPWPGKDVKISSSDGIHELQGEIMEWQTGSGETYQIASATES